VLEVQDFQKVFPKELLGLPPRRGAEFTIELLPSTQPMTPNELKELKAQLEELVEKGFYPTQFILVGRTSIVHEKER